MGLYQAGAGVGVSPSGRHPVGIYKQTRGTAQWAVPLFRFSCPGTQEKGTPPPAPPPLRGGGELEAAAPPEASGSHCRTRRPRLPLVRHRPFGPGCGRASYWQSGGPLASAASAEARAALPERPTQTGSGCPPRWGTPAIAAPRGQCKRKRCRPGQRPRRGHPFRVPTAPPVALAAPAPRPHRSAAQQRAGRFRSVAPCAPYRVHPVAHRLTPVPSLHDPRHRCCTGSRLLAALPALHALRHRSGKAAAPGSGQGVRTEAENGSSWLPYLRITQLQLYAAASSCRAACAALV